MMALKEMPKVGDKVRIIEEPFTDETHVGEIYEVTEIDGRLINVNGTWSDGSTMNLKKGEYEIVEEAEPQPDVTGLIANLGRRVHDLEVSDAVNSPQHYTQGDIEVIDYIDQVASGYEGKQAYYVGNIVKYVSRAPYKNGLEDVKKCAWYIQRLIDVMEAESAQ